MAVALSAPVLEGTLVRLEPLAPEHADDLAAAVEKDRSTFAFTWVPTPDEVRDYIATQVGRAKTGTFTPYAQVARATGRAVGATAYFEPRPRPWPGQEDQLLAVEVGFTWLAAAAQGTGINAEAKLLLFTNAFEAWQVARVDLKTDERNERSRAAIAATGAHFEGILRNWSRSWAPGEAGRLRNSAIFSITAEEWPAVKEHLSARVRRAAAQREDDA